MKRASCSSGGMIPRQGALTLTWLGALAGCVQIGNVTHPLKGVGFPVDAPGAVVFVGAGDIARCGHDGDEQTAQVVDSLIRADSLRGIATTVFTAGDNAYPAGTEVQFHDCYGLSWGRRVMKALTYPVPGNHEYHTPEATPYYAYFGDRAGARGIGYYSYDLGSWHIIALNSELVVNGKRRRARQTQEAWLRADLQAQAQRQCTLAYWHNPRFSSGWHKSDAKLQPIWQMLYDAGADVVISGHDHDYERFAPQTPSGATDAARGIREFVVGTGGGSLRRFPHLARNSEIRISGQYGVLMLILELRRYRWEFLTVDGQIWDAGQASCHDVATTHPVP